MSDESKTWFFSQMKFDVFPPSKVVHLRGLPIDVTEQEVIRLGVAYGKVTNLLLLKVSLHRRFYFVSYSKNGLGTVVGFSC